MGLHKFLLLAIAATTALSGMLHASSASEASVEKQREKARALLYSSREHEKAAQAYVHLLKTVDDKKSGEDMIRLIKACEYIETTLSPEKVLDISLMPQFPDEGQDSNRAIESSGASPQKTAAKKSFIDLNALINTYMPRHKDNPHFIMEVADYFCDDARHYISTKDGVSFRPLSYAGERGFTSKNCNEADRKKAFVMYKELLDKHLNDPELKKDKNLLVEIMEGFINALQHSENTASYTTFLRKTDISTNVTPDQKEEDPFSSSSNRFNMPIDDNGKPIIPSIPASWEQATNDLERAFYLYEQALALAPEKKKQELRLHRAKFISSLFSPSTLIRHAIFGDDEAATITALRERANLSNNQTIVFINGKPVILTLPPLLDYMGELERIALLPAKDETKYDICFALAEELTGRNRLKEALKWIDEAGKYTEKDEDKELIVSKAKRQITQPTAMLIPNEGESCYIPQAEGHPLSVGIFYRNMDSANISLRRIDVDAIARDFPKKDKKGDTIRELQIINDILSHAINPESGKESSEKYLSKSPITATQKIASTPDHIDRFAELNLPKASPGLYLLEVNIAKNRSLYRIINISNLTLASRPCPEGIMWIVANASTGYPVEGAEIKGTFIEGNNNPDSEDPFADPSEPTDSKKEKLRFIPFAGKTNTEGIVIVPVSEKAKKNRIPASCVARYDQSVALYAWMEQLYLDYGNFDNIGDDHITILFQTSQPVYKPGQTVKAQGRIVAANYLKPSLSTLANKKWEIKVHDPMGNQIDIGKKSVTTDASGAFPFEYTLPEHAKLGRYTVNIRPQNANKKEYGYTNDFYVEEYKKPEFEVSITPQAEIVQLGNPVQFSIQANYYAGGPVAGGKAVVNVKRNSLRSGWKPSWKWSWLSELLSPSSHGYSTSTTVMDEHQVILDDQGKAVITLPTEQDKKDFEKTAQEYSIEISVTDASLREVTASGSILAPVLPFEAFAELDSNYVRSGENIPVSLFARTIQGKPVSGITGTATLSRISLEKGVIVETKVSSVPVSMDDEGNGSLATQADKPGSYKLSLDLKNPEGKQSSISKEFMCYGAAKDAGTPPFPSPRLKLTPEKKAYAPGETAQILVTSSNPNAYIWTFIRSGWKNETLKTLALKNQSGVLPVETSRADMPNFGISAFTIFNGQIYGGTTSILLPPENKTLDVQATSNEPTYQPGQEGTIAIQIKTPDGKPSPANTQVTLTIYDKALNYLSQENPPLLQQLWGFSNPENPPSLNIQSNEFNNDNRVSLSSDDSPETFTSSVVLGENLSDGYFSDDTPEWIWCLISTHFDAKDREKLESFDRAWGSASSDPFASDPFCEDSMIASASRAPWVANKGIQYAPQTPSTPADLTDVEKAWETPFDTQGTNATPKVRSNFMDNIKWCGTLVTDEKGQVHVPFKTSDDLTTWEAKAWAISPDLSVGEATVEFICAKDLMISLQTPRFLVGGDTVTISAVVRNQTDAAIDSSVTLAPSGCAHFEKTSLPATQKVSVPAKGQNTVNWTIKAEGNGTAEFTAEAKGSKSDAMKLSIPVLIHGMKQVHAFNAIMLPEQKESRFEVKLPADIRRKDTVLNISLSPSVALTMIDALPYLIDYPYGCAEQTLNKFLPALIVRQTMKDYGIDLAKLGKGTLGTPQQATALQKVNKQREHNPVFDEQKFDTIVRNNLTRLLDAQMANGAWGWFGGLQAKADPMITATVYHGLLLAQKTGTAIPQNALDKAKQWLASYENKQVALLKHGDEREKMTAEQKDKDKKDYLTQPNALDAKIRLALQQSGISNDAMTAYLKRDSEKLPVYGQLLFAQSLAMLNEKDAATGILRHLDQYLSIDESLQTAHLTQPNEGCWWFWYGDNVSTQAAYLDLLCAIDPQSPNMARFAKWLVLNRTNGAYWNSTMDTSNAVHALSRYLSITKEGMDPMEAEIYYGDRLIGTIKTDKNTLLTANREITLKGEEACTPAIDGKIPVTVKRTQGKGNIYIDATLDAFTMQDPLPATGNALCISRTYYLIGKKTHDATGQSDKGTIITRPVTKETRTPLPENSTVNSGDTIEVELSITLKNDVEYLLLSDPKPAGCESKDLTSGYDYCGNVFCYREAGAQSTRFFISNLKAGTHTITFRLRPERPGQFSALPTVIEAMYAPALRGNSREDKMDVVHETK